jgi:hypothetical protein
MTPLTYYLDGSSLVEIGRPRAMYLTYDEQGRFALTDGEFIEPRLYLHVGKTGEVIGNYARDPYTYALDDYFYILDVYYVRGDTLYVGGIEMGGPPGVFRCTLMTPYVRLRGLRQASASGI